MAKKKKARGKADTRPNFPYTTAPGALRRLLKEIPTRPKPGKLTLPVLKTWKVINGNDASPLRVLKDIGFLSASGEPLQPYADYMVANGARSLGARLRDLYKELFATSHEPHKHDDELKTFFNIHGGGGERTIDLEIQTFKALSEYADFTGAPAGGAAATGGDERGRGVGRAGDGGAGMPPLQLDLHIHLPPGASTREYEAIIQDIAKYIYGRTVNERA